MKLKCLYGWSLTEHGEVIEVDGSLHYANDLTIKGFAFISHSFSIALQTSCKVRYCCLLATEKRIEFSTFLACLLNFTSLLSVVLKVNSTNYRCATYFTLSVSLLGHFFFVVDAWFQFCLFVWLFFFEYGNGRFFFLYDSLFWIFSNMGLC